VYNAFEPNIEYIVRHKQQGPIWQLDHEVATAEGGILLRWHMVQPQYPLQVHSCGSSTSYTTLRAS